MDRWELRCWFRHERVFERLQAGELRTEMIDSKPGGRMSGQPMGSVIEILRIIDNSTNDEVAEVNWFKRPDQTVGASGEMDPAYMIVKGVNLRRFKGGPDKFRREPELLFPGFFGGFLRKRYGDFRKACCTWLGPERDGALAAKMFPILKHLCFWHDLRRPA